MNHGLVWMAAGRAMSAEDFHTLCLCREDLAASAERLGTVGVAKASALKDAQHSWLSNSFLQSANVIVKSVTLGSY